MEKMAQTLTLRSTIDTDYTVVVDSRVIDCSSILKNVQVHTNDNEEIEVKMAKKHLEKFVQLHNHFQTSSAPKDIKWTNDFFRGIPDEEFKELCFQADFLDSERFLEAVGDFVVEKFNELPVAQIQAYLNVVDDFSVEERTTIEEHPLEFFSGVSTQLDEAAAAAKKGDK